MCLILTICTALALSGVYFYQRKKSCVSKNVFDSMLMFWSASLMWSMDGLASVLSGEGFFDLSIEDTILGAIILACGMTVFAVFSIMQRRKSV